MMKSMTGFGLECRKIRRTGLTAAFVAGGILAAAFPVLNMAVRSELYTGLRQTPVRILLQANWQMMAMMNILLAVAGACLMYHTEYADRAMQKMCTLPVQEGSLFFSKAVWMAVFCMVTLMIEAAAVLFCSVYWFGKPDMGLLAELIQNFGGFFCFMLPAVTVSLGIASACENMWVSLGIGVLFVSVAVMLPADRFIPSLFPFALPFQIVSGLEKAAAGRYFAASVAEMLLAGAAEFLFLKIRRIFS